MRAALLIVPACAQGGYPSVPPETWWVTATQSGRDRACACVSEWLHTQCSCQAFDGLTSYLH
ncbi:hypothetical protein J6590_087241, partial [Homalodisca vitripennis]